MKKPVDATRYLCVSSVYVNCIPLLHNQTLYPSLSSYCAEVHIRCPIVKSFVLWKFTVMLTPCYEHRNLLEEHLTNE